jgi:transcriptional regulator with XRE-family HTH domain
MRDKRYETLDKDKLEEFRRLKAFTLGDLSDVSNVSVDTIKRAEAGKTRAQRGTLKKLAGALGVEPKQIMRDFLPESPEAPKVYTWEDMLAGARKVGEHIYKDGELLVDAVLTFPGASSIFCGIVLTMLPVKIFLRVPVYTGVFVDLKTPTSKRKRYFHEIKARSFKVLIPRELTEGRKRIIVIDDSIISGGVMEVMRKSLVKKCGPDNVKFACCICYEGRTLLTVTPPEVVGLKPLEKRIRFPMPWGCDSYSFEEAFVPDAPPL